MPQSKSDEPRLATGPHGLLGDLFATVDHALLLVDLQHILKTLPPLQTLQRRQQLVLLFEFEFKLVGVDHGVIVPLVGVVPDHDHSIG